MKISFFKTTAKREKPALFFFLKLVILGCLLKCIFFVFNYRITNGWDISTATEVWNIIRWSVLYDTVILALMMLAYLLLLYLARSSTIFKKAAAAIVTILITAFVCLNTIDIFYYPFHLQRADADLLFVVRNPLTAANATVWLVIVAVAIFTAAVAVINYRAACKLAGRIFPVTIITLISFVLLFAIPGSKKLLPTFPLTVVKPVQLPLVQNSLHTFLYSLYRRDESRLPESEYFSNTIIDSIMPIYKKNESASIPKNIVLFIMESVPLEFFDSASPYKATTPFLDDLLNKSTLYTNAFSYAYTSNKGITATLAGLPTLTDIPLYHSNYTSINRTSIGTVLTKQGYSSAFFIGDNYDDFGFAKCARWLGINKYYSMEAIPGYRQMEQHPMGLHDEYVLGFMEKKISKMKPPFLAINYNISTHYPNNLPNAFTSTVGNLSGSPQMKSMQYYDRCLQSFFTAAAKQPWYKNSVFIFCSDHWAQPGSGTIAINGVNSFRIPIFIYEPAAPIKQRISAPVSQLDIVNTLTYYGGVQDSFFSFGTNLREAVLHPDRTVFCKTNSAVYHAINENYVLGFDAEAGRALYCYNYRNDAETKINLIPTSNDTITRMVMQMKAFLQKAVQQHRKSGDRLTTAPTIN